MSGVTGDDWANLAAHVSIRLRNLGLSNMKRLAAKSGVSDTTWRNLKKGQPVVFSGKPEQIMDTLGWTYESWATVLASGEPTLRDPESDATGSGERVHLLEDRVLTLEQRLRDLESRLQD